MSAPPPPPPPDYFGGGAGGGGAGIAGGAVGTSGTGNPATAQTGRWWIYGLGASGITSTKTSGAGGDGGAVGSAGSSGANTASPMANFANSGGAAGPRGPAGTQGDRGPAILGNGNITFVNAGTITGTNTSATTYTPTVTAVDFVGGQANTGGTTMTMPSGIANGDFAIWFGVVYATTLPAKTIPSGFTEIDHASFDTTGTINDILGTIAYKTLNGSETTVTGYNAKNTLLVFRPNNPYTTVTISAVNSQATSGTPTSQTVLANNQATPMLVFAHYGSTSAGTRSSNVTMLEFSNDTADGSNPSQSVKVLRYKNGDTPQNILISMPDGGTNVLQSFYVTFS